MDQHPTPPTQNYSPERTLISRPKAGPFPIERSNQLKKRATGLIPSLTQTLAKGPTQFVQGIAPIYIERGKGCIVWDVDGNSFLDLGMAIGPISLGYCYPAVDTAIQKQLEKGITFTLMSPLEVEVAELIRDTVPGVESVRFSKTGADATSAAIRLARAFTGRKRIVSCGYHGWHDWYIGVTDKNQGIPIEVRDLTTTFSYNDIGSLKAALNSDVAAVILEPVLFEPPKEGFLQELKAVCRHNGTLLIFDEMWTGFRVAPGGCQEAYDVQADMVTFSKAIANGMPLSVLCGRHDILSLLEKDVFFYTTFGGEALSLAAAQATIKEIKDKNVPKHTAKVGSLIQKGLDRLLGDLKIDYLKCVGLPCRTLLAIQGNDSLILKSVIQQELLLRGILWSGAHVMSYSHTEEDAESVLRAYEEILPSVHEAVLKGSISTLLKGEPVQPVFRTITGNAAEKKL